MLKNIKAAIFDMDGTLVDSMWIWEKIDETFLQKRNIPLPHNLKDEIEKFSFEETAYYFKSTFNLDESIEEIMQEWHDIAFDYYKTKVTLKSGAKRFLLLLKSMGIKIALATSNSKELLETALKANNIYEYFDVITRTDEVDRGKNFPDVYLLTAKRLNIPPEHCIVFEDILAAVQGAKLAGMKVVGVFDAYSEHQKNDIMKIADRYIIEYNEIIKDAV